MRVVYVSPEFPKTRHGFEAEELAEMARRGRDVAVISMRRPNATGWRWLRSGYPDVVALSITWLSPVSGLLGLLWVAFVRPRALLSIAALVRLAAQRDVKGAGKTLLGAIAGCALAWRIRGRQSEWIHADFSSAPATAALVASEILGIPFSFCARAFDVFSTIPAGWATEAVLAEKLRRVAIAFAENTAAAARLRAIAAGEPSQAPVVIKRNGVRVADATRVRPPRGDFHVVGLGALVPKKGFDTVIRAAHAARSVIPNITVTIHGEGSERRELEQLARDLSVPLTLPGEYSRDKLQEILDAASVVVVASRKLASGDSDGVPTVLIEALAAGCPVIGANVGSVVDLVRDGKTGVLIPPDDVDALADAFVRYHGSPAEAAQLASRGHALVLSEFGVGTAVDVFERELQAVRQKTA